MIGIDTNVLVRLIVSDDLDQQRIARQRVERARQMAEKVLITPVVLSEIGWVLRRGYGYGRAAIADVVDALAQTPPFEFMHHEAVLEANDRYRDGRADLSDYLLAALCVAEEALPILTFDTHFGAEPDCELLS